MTVHTLLRLVQQARDEVKTILRALEETGHPQTSESNSLYLALVVLQKRVAALRPGSPLGGFASELEQLASMCKDKLVALKPLLEEAVRVVRSP